MDMRIITQTQIHSFERCRRLYYLKYVRELAWPVSRAVPSEITRGTDFHLLVRQLLLGVPREALALPEDNGTMERWIDNFLREKPLRNRGKIMAEKEVSALYAGTLWLGKYDVLAVDGDQLTIFDWKTTSRRAEVAAYLRSPQTRLYRFLAKRLGARLTGKDGIPAENIEMIYWFPEHPERQICLPYSEEAYQEDLTWLDLKARELSMPDEKDYPYPADKSKCADCDYCTYCFPVSADDGDSAYEETEPADSDYIFQEEFNFDDMNFDTEQEEINF